MKLFVSLLVLLLVISCTSLEKKEIKKQNFIGFQKHSCEHPFTDKRKKSRKISSSLGEKKDFYFFSDWSGARDRIKAFASQHDYEMELHDRNSARYKKMYLIVEQSVDKVLQEYLNLYPHLKKSLRRNRTDLLPLDFKKKKPFVVLFTSNDISSFVFKTKDSPTYFLIALKVADIITASGTVNLGVIAHEMAHLLLQKSSSQASKEFPKAQYYNHQKVDYSKPLFDQIDEDLNLQNKMKLWEEYASWAGELSSFEFRGVGYTHKFSRTPFLLAALLYSITNTRCKDLVDQFNTVLDLVPAINKSGGFEYLKDKLVWSDRKLIASQFLARDQLLKSCLGETQAKFVDIYKYVNDKTDDQINMDSAALEADLVLNSSDPDFIQQAITFFNEQTLYNALFKTILLARSKMRAIEKKVNFKNIRRYNREVHADEMAVKVLSSLGIDWSGLFSSSVIRAPQFKKCGEPPQSEPYTPINMLHHTQCWRFWRASQLKF